MPRLMVTPAARNHQKHCRFIFHVSWLFSTYQSVKTDTTKDDVTVTAAARNGCGTAAMPNLRTTRVAPPRADAAIGYQRKTAEPPSCIARLCLDTKTIPAMII